MNINFYSLSWNNNDPRIIENQKKVLELFNVNINYTFENIDHGTWMDDVINSSNDQIIGFIDSDCIPTNREIIDFCINYTEQKKSFIGIAQVTNHIPPATHIYAAPPFLIINRDMWKNIGKPSLKCNSRSDAGEELSYRAEELGITYKTLYPKLFEKLPKEGLPWKLSNYGYFGIGTYFEGGIYHLYQGRYSDNVDLFCLRAEQICYNKFDLSNFKFNSILTF